MRSGVIALCISCVFPTATQPYPIPSQSMWKSKRVVIAASEILDGKGRVLHDTRIVIDGSKIVAIDPKAGPVDYDLRGLTVLPGWIDAHVHITWSFGPDGKNVGEGGTSQEAAYTAASNAWLTLMAGFTTVQDVGSPTAIPFARCHCARQTSGPAHTDRRRIALRSR
jgi:imidazolonepropionase-like amidohydrolase